MKGKMYQKSIVAFMDILGFSEIVEKTNDAFKVVDIIESLKNEKKAMIKEISAKNIEITWFSDCIVISSPLTLDYVHLILEIIQQMQSELIHLGILLRGGITIGDCYHKNDRLFGPAMIEAYKLESKTARVPRIILSVPLMKFINESHILEERYIDKKYEENILGYQYYDASDITEMYTEEETIADQIFRVYIKKDNDDYFFIDYLEFIMSMSIHYNDFNEFEYDLHINPYDKEYYEECFISTISPLKNFIQSNLKGEHMSVILKYVWLKNYYNSILDKYKPKMSKEFIKDYFLKMYIN
jgi:hypothetical protein